MLTISGVLCLVLAWGFVVLMMRNEEETISGKTKNQRQGGFRQWRSGCKNRRGISLCLQRDAIGSIKPRLTAFFPPHVAVLFFRVGENKLEDTKADWSVANKRFGMGTQPEIITSTKHVVSCGTFFAEPVVAYNYLYNPFESDPQVPFT